MKKKEYVPYGPEWEREMMRHDKKHLIFMVRAQGNELRQLKDSVCKYNGECPKTRGCTLCGYSCFEKW